MSSDTPPPTGEPSPHEHRPNWGSAYPQTPPVGSSQPPPPGGYGQAPYTQPSYTQPAYGLPKHPSATTAMVLGIVAVAGGVLCWLPLLISPAAWIMGSRAVQEIDASGGVQAGRGEAMAGKVLGIIGTVLLALGVLAIVAFFALLFSLDDFS